MNLSEELAAKPHLGGGWTPYDPRCYSPRLIEWLVRVFPLRHVVDIGAGGGEASRSFRANGVSVIAVEGLESVCCLTDVPTICHDFETGPLKLFNVDCIHACEFVEHVSNWPAVLETFCCAKLLCFSHAVPGQTGHHHVNEQTDEWFIERVKAKGFRYLAELTLHARRISAGSYMGETALLFLKDGVDWGTLAGSFREG